jgi:hypothetical protein
MNKKLLRLCICQKTPFETSKIILQNAFEYESRSKILEGVLIFKSFLQLGSKQC